jgi:hypothetical protein
MYRRAEINKLAAEILELVLQQWREEGELNKWFYKVLYDQNGEVCLVYEGLSKHGYGEFLCYYRPKQAVEKIIVESERLFDNFTIHAYLKDEAREIDVRLVERVPKDFRDKKIEQMATLATMLLLEGLKKNIGNALQENHQDSLFFAEAALNNQIAEYLSDKEGFSKVKADVRADIKDKVKEVADIKSAWLTKVLRHLPALIAKVSRGRPRKDNQSRAKTKQEYEARILQAMRALRSERELMSKANVARRLNLGSEKNRTQAMNNKLEQSGIDWDTLVSQV